MRSQLTIFSQQAGKLRCFLRSANDEDKHTQRENSQQPVLTRWPDGPSSSPPSHLPALTVLPNHLLYHQLHRRRRRRAPTHSTQTHKLHQLGCSTAHCSTAHCSLSTIEITKLHIYSFASFEFTSFIGDICNIACFSGIPHSLSQKALGMGILMDLMS